MNVFEFVKLTKSKKELLLQTEGIFLENFSEEERITNVYYLGNFFVEQTFDKGKLESVPYERGYKLSQRALKEIEERNNKSLPGLN
jgi:hypothetical protein